MTRRQFVWMPALCVLLAACSSSAKSATTATTTATTTTAAQPSTTIITTSRRSVFVLATDPTAHTITVDPMDFLTGPAAATAFHKANPNAPGGPDNDYFIVNAKKEHDVLPLAADATVRLVQSGGVVHTVPVPATQAQLASYPALAIHPFWITVSGDTVTKVNEQFVP